MKILAIETSCDETCAAVTEGTRVFSNVVWSQVDLHKEFGGVVPSLARRAHEEKIDWVVGKAIRDFGLTTQAIDAVAVTAGPGLAIALEVGIKWARQLAQKWHKPLIAVNHIEGHVLSPLVGQNSLPQWPAMALVVSGKHTELIWIEKIGQYTILARTIDDALGESLDKAARLLGLGYPGGAQLEKKARQGQSNAYSLPLPMLGREKRREFSYSGLKTAFYRLVDRSSNPLGKKQICDLAASYQDVAFRHLLRIAKKTLEDYPVQDLLIGGGVAINRELHHRLERLGRDLGCKIWWPAAGTYGDNAAMIGVAAGFRAQRGHFDNPDQVDRKPRWRIDESLLAPFAIGRKNV